MANAKRFSKAVVLEYIAQRTDALKKEHRLDPGNGTAQLRGRDEAVAVAYGEFRALLDMARDINGGYL